MRTAAFFDIDHTLIGADSGMLFMRYLLQQGLLKRRDLVRPIYYTLLHRLNLQRRLLRFLVSPSVRDIRQRWKASVRPPRWLSSNRQGSLYPRPKKRSGLPSRGWIS